MFIDHDDDMPHEIIQSQALSRINFETGEYLRITIIIRHSLRVLLIVFYLIRAWQYLGHFELDDSFFFNILLQVLLHMVLAKLMLLKW